MGAGRSHIRISAQFLLPLFSLVVTRPETHTKRQATKHGCLPSLPGDGDKGIEIVYLQITMRKKVFCTRPTRASKAKQKYHVRHDKLKEPTKNKPLSYVLFESHSPQFQQLARDTPL